MVFASGLVAGAHRGEYALHHGIPYHFSGRAVQFVAQQVKRLSQFVGCVGGKQIHLKTLSAEIAQILVMGRPRPGGLCAQGLEQA